MKFENLETRKQRVSIIISELEKLFPQPKATLHYSNNLELLIAVILSAQCTDKMVNKVTEKLFEKYKKLDDYINTTQVTFENDIRSIGLYRSKAKNILATAKIIKQKFHGEVPNNMKDLLDLPGVARKTANIVLQIAYGKIEGIAVDTHVRRLSMLYGLTNHNDPVKIEQDLVKIIPRKEWINFSLRMINYGREYCPARSHDHKNCPLTKVLKYLG